MGQSLYGDERYTYSIVSANGVAGVWHQVYATSITPPLHYYLAWLSIQFGGDRTVLVRLPSLLLGTATIPLLFVLARRIGGNRVGLLAAGLLALSPFAIFYSTEARAYETVVFLVTLSTVALLKARDGDGRGWWVVYALSSCAAIWAHYTAAFVLIAGAVWALWTQPWRWRTLLIVDAAIIVGYLPWLPGYLHQRHNQGVALYDQFSSITVGSVFDFPLRTLIGHPFVALSSVPGNLGLLLVLGVLVLLPAAVVHRTELVHRLPPPPTRQAAGRWARSEAGVIGILAVATPVGLLLYAVVGSTLWSSDRELSASEPALVVIIALAVGLLMRTVSVRLAAAVVAGLGAVLAVIAVHSVGADNQRPPYRAAAHYLDAVAGSSPVVELPLAVSPDQRLRQSTLSLYFNRPHPLYTSGQDDGSAWREERTGRSLYYVMPLQGPVLAAQGLSVARAALLARTAKVGGPDGLALVTSTRTFAGFYPLVVQRYQGVVSGRLERHEGRETISWSLGKSVAISPQVAVGVVAGISPSNGPLLIRGWAYDAGRHEPVEWFLFFSGGRLFAVAQGGLRSKAGASRAYGPSSSLASFGLGIRDAPNNHSTIRVFAVVGDQASELRFTPAARADAG